MDCFLTYHLLGAVLTTAVSLYSQKSTLLLLSWNCLSGHVCWGRRTQKRMRRNTLPQQLFLKYAF